MTAPAEANSLEVDVIKCSEKHTFQNWAKMFKPKNFCPQSEQNVVDIVKVARAAKA
jgi:hypothetical protein